jgi:hypothetical protein
MFTSVIASDIIPFASVGRRADRVRGATVVLVVVLVLVLGTEQNAIESRTSTRTSTSTNSWVGTEANPTSEARSPDVKPDPPQAWF